MKKIAILFVIFLGYGCISCGNVEKKEVKASDNVVPEDSQIYMINKIIVPKPTKKLQVYKSPTKTAQQLICVEDESGEFYETMWGSTIKGYAKEFDMLPVIEETDAWYKVYVNIENPCGVGDKFIGYVLKSNSNVSPMIPVEWKDIENDLLWHELHTCIRKDLGYYIKWGIVECSGPALYIGKIENGFIMETNEICFAEDSDISKIYIGNMVFTNPRYFRENNNYENQISTDIHKFSTTDLNRILSLVKKGFPRIAIKIKDDNYLHWIQTGDTIDNHKIIWGF